MTSISKFHTFSNPLGDCLCYKFCKQHLLFGHSNNQDDPLINQAPNQKKYPRPESLTDEILKKHCGNPADLRQ